MVNPAVNLLRKETIKAVNGKFNAVNTTSSANTYVLVYNLSVIFAKRRVLLVYVGSFFEFFAVMYRLEQTKLPATTVNGKK